MAIFQTFTVFTNDTGAHFQNWGQAFGQAFLDGGWVAQTGHGELVATNVSGTWTWTTTPNAPTAATVLNKLIPNFRGAWVSGTTYTSSNTTTSGSVCDVVTNGGLTYIHTTASSSSATAPGSDTTNWQPWQFEIWKSNDALSSTLPIYVKLVYTNVATSTPRLIFSIGTGVDVNGNLTNALNLASAAPFQQALYSPTTVGNSSPVSEFDACYNNANLSLCWPRNGGSTGVLSVGAAGPFVLIIDRAKTSTGADADAFVAVYVLTVIGSSSVETASGILLKPSLGGTIMNFAGAPATNPWPGVLSAPTAGSFGNFGSSPAMPVFPLPGYVANPTLGLVTTRSTDFATGSILPVWLYGTEHTFLCVGNEVTLSTYLELCGTSTTGVGLCPAIRWE